MTTPFSGLCADGHHLDCLGAGERGPFKTLPLRRDCHCPCHVRSLRATRAATSSPATATPA